MDKHLFTRKGFTLAAHAGSLAQRVQNDGRAHRLYAAAQQLILAFVLSRGTMFGGYAPFGLAAAAAAAGAGGGYAALLGLVLGSFLLCGGLYGITAAAGGVLALVCAHVFDKDTRRKVWFMPACAMACMAATSFVLIPSAAPAELARFACATLAAGAMTACYGFALATEPPAARMMRPVGFLAVAASLCVALSDLTLLGTISPARILLYALVLALLIAVGLLFPQKLFRMHISAILVLLAAMYGLWKLLDAKLD